MTGGGDQKRRFLKEVDIFGLLDATVNNDQKKTIGNGQTDDIGHF